MALLSAVRVRLALLVALLVIAATSGYLLRMSSAPVKVGFVGPLTGRSAGLGKAGLNGVVLAAERTNAAGGIKGRTVEIVAKDDQQDPERARTVDRDLIGEGVTIAVGHMTSAMSKAAIPVLQTGKLLMISPTTSSNDLTGKDDNFLRIYPSGSSMARRLAHYARQSGLGRMAIIYDSDNLEHSLGWAAPFQNSFASEGGKILKVESFSSASVKGFLPLAKKIARHRPEGILIIANSLDTAVICQQLKKIGLPAQLFVTEWSTTNELLEYGGNAVEGIIFLQNFNREDQSRTYLDFREAYVRRFAEEPSFASTLSYEAALVAFAALSRASEPAEMKNIIISTSRFKGLQGEIIIDAFGDGGHAPMLLTVRNGRFLPLVRQ